jgi:hypothetical protein
MTKDNVQNVIFVLMYSRHRLLDLINSLFCSQYYDSQIVSLVVAQSWLSAGIKTYVVNAAHIF